MRTLMIPRHHLAGMVLLIAALMALGGCATRRSRPDPAYASAPQHLVVEGDTLSSISERYNVDIATIIKANRLAHKTLVPGQVLYLPGARVDAPRVARAIPEPAPEVDTSTDWFIARSTWSVQSIDVPNTDPMAPIYRLTVHHSSEHGDASGDPVDMLRLFEKNHKSKGWACIGYHFIIAADGQVYEGRPLKYQGAHASGDNNIGNVGICLLGNFERDSVPQAQRAALMSVLDRLVRRYGIARTEIHGHREFKTTDCPGRFLLAIVDEYRGGNGELAPERPAATSRPSRAPAKRASATTTKKTRR
ncbi:MAG: N-acetylmuramoyl-L-alanine amidase [Planctomycetes bacterium]|nr:N-acetylmuramoyl-L-alanine amidase [Planctomycetota bacterium]